ncbi:MAG: EI24 domain-containing protein [Crocinitomicaceae bacterium]|nr:EI24 domain-containing protein [Crocinitomicaceae bacterium]
MQFFKLLGLGFKNYFKGINFLITHKLYWFVIFPIIIFIGLYNLGHYFEALEWTISYDLKHNIGEIETVNGLIWMTLKIIFYDQLYYMFTKFTMYFVIICLAPVLAIVSEKIEEKLTGNKYKWNFFQLVKDIFRAMKLNLRLILIEYAIVLIFILIGTLIGGVTKYVLVSVIPILIGFYFYGFGYIDYINERRRLDIPQSIHFVSKHRGLAIAIGSIFSICFLSFNYVFIKFDTIAIDTNSQILWGSLLVVTFILASVAPLLAVTSATLSMHELVDLSKNQYALKKEEDEETKKDGESIE